MTFPTPEDMQRKYPALVRIGKTGRVRMKGKAMAELRNYVYLRDGRRCVDCGMHVIEQSGSWASMHLMHLQGRGADGSDVPENVACGCIRCHLTGRHNPKSVQRATNDI